MRVSEAASGLAISCFGTSRSCDWRAMRCSDCVARVVADVALKYSGDRWARGNRVPPMQYRTQARALGSGNPMSTINEPQLPELKLGLRPTAGLWGVGHDPRGDSRILYRLHDGADRAVHRDARGAHGHGDGDGVDLRRRRRVLGGASRRQRGGDRRPHRVDADARLLAGDGSVDRRRWRWSRAGSAKRDPRGRRQCRRSGDRCSACSSRR